MQSSGNLDAIAITDHNTLKGSEKARIIRKSEDVEIIPGVEIGVPISPYGLHLIGLFIDDYDPPRDLKEAIENIKKKGGIVILPHPFRIGTGLFYHLEQGLISESDARLVLNGVDYIEGLTHKCSNGGIKQTLNFVRTTQHSVVAGTDSHKPENVGLVWTELENIGKFKAGNALMKMSALVKPGWDRMLESLECYLVDHKLPSESNESRPGFNKVIKLVRNMIPNPKIRLILKKRYSQIITMRRRRFIEKEVRSARTILISKKGDSSRF